MTGGNIGLFLTVVAVVTLASTARGARAAEPGPDWTLTGSAQREVSRDPASFWQCSAGEANALLVTPPGEGNVWRCMVEPGPTVERCGMWFAASQDLTSGLLLSLGTSEDAAGLQLSGPGGAVLWADRHAPWTFYTPCVLEAVTEEGRVRVQMFQWDAKTLLAQSEWVDLPKHTQGPGMGLHTKGGAARFYRWTRADEPLSPIVANSPTKLRLKSAGGSAWAVVDEGDWRWMHANREVLRQGAELERSSAIHTGYEAGEGVWRCRVRIEEDTGGAGLLIRTDATSEEGFLVWLGGEWGNGSLILYRRPLEALWSSAQGKWAFNTDYVLEGCIADGKVSGRLLEADGETVIAASPEVPLVDADKPFGYIGFMTYHGQARFWDFPWQEDAGEQRAAQAQQNLPGWNVIEGQWRTLKEPEGALEITAGPATALSNQVQGTRGRWRCQVTPSCETSSVSLLFQVSPDLKKGFECRLGKGAVLRELSGRTLWTGADFAWRAGVTYVLEGNVLTDRVAVRILDAQGAVRAESEETYVSDTNNTRLGVLGVRGDDKGTRFSSFSVESFE